MRRKILRAVTLMADGYEILRPVKGSSPILGTDSLMGKPATGEQMHPPYRLSREVFNRYRAEGFIEKATKHTGRAQWVVWIITEKGRAEAAARPNPSREEIAACRRAAKA